MDWDTLLNNERRRQTTMPGDHREEFERDYDRSVFSSPVKRLQDKTQVFPLEPHDSVRTRLTHSLEVSSVARGLVRKVDKAFLSKILKPGQERQIEAIAATCGLLHDLGNTPFGHSGENAIQEWIQKTFADGKLSELLKDNAGKPPKEEWINDFLLFEGNAQTLRVVTKLQVLADFEGLNLTYGTLSALCKYTANSLQAGKGNNHAHEKTGYFSSEADVVADIRKKTGTGDARNPITFLVEAADDIVYSVADVEDGIKKGVLSWHAFHELLKKAPAAAQPSITEALKTKDKILAPHGAVEELPDDVHAAAFRTGAIGALVFATAKSFEEHYDDIMKGKFERDLVTACDGSALIELMKEIGRSQIYCTPSNLKLELMGRCVIQDLLTLFWEGAMNLRLDGKVKTKNFSGKLQALLSKTYRKVFQHWANQATDLPINYYRLQLVIDYVCGMTDSFAKKLHAELTNGQ